MSSERANEGQPDPAAPEDVHIRDDSASQFRAAQDAGEIRARKQHKASEADAKARQLQPKGPSLGASGSQVDVITQLLHVIADDAQPFSMRLRYVESVLEVFKQLLASRGVAALDSVLTPSLIAALLRTLHSDMAQSAMAMLSDLLIGSASTSEEIGARLEVTACSNAVRMLLEMDVFVPLANIVIGSNVQEGHRLQCGMTCLWICMHAAEGAMCSSLMRRPAMIASMVKGLTRPGASEVTKTAAVHLLIMPVDQATLEAIADAMKHEPIAGTVWETLCGMTAAAYGSWAVEAILRRVRQLAVLQRSLYEQFDNSVWLSTCFDLLSHPLASIKAEAVQSIVTVVHKVTNAVDSSVMLQASICDSTRLQALLDLVCSSSEALLSQVLGLLATLSEGHESIRRQIVAHQRCIAALEEDLNQWDASREVPEATLRAMRVLQNCAAVPLASQKLLPSTRQSCLRILAALLQSQGAPQSARAVSPTPPSASTSRPDSASCSTESTSIHGTSQAQEQRVTRARGPSNAASARVPGSATAAPAANTTTRNPKERDILHCLLLLECMVTDDETARAVLGQLLPWTKQLLAAGVNVESTTAKLLSSLLMRCPADSLDCPEIDDLLGLSLSAAKSMPAERMASVLTLFRELHTCRPSLWSQLVESREFKQLVLTWVSGPGLQGPAQNALIAILGVAAMYRNARSYILHDDAVLRPLCEALLGNPSLLTAGLPLLKELLAHSTFAAQLSSQGVDAGKVVSTITAAPVTPSILAHARLAALLVHREPADSAATLDLLSWAFKVLKTEAGTGDSDAAPDDLASLAAAVVMDAVRKPGAANAQRAVSRVGALRAISRVLRTSTSPSALCSLLVALRSLLHDEDMRSAVLNAELLPEILAIAASAQQWLAAAVVRRWEGGTEPAYIVTPRLPSTRSLPTLDGAPLLLAHSDSASVPSYSAARYTPRHDYVRVGNSNLKRGVTVKLPSITKGRETADEEALKGLSALRNGAIMRRASQHPTLLTRKSTTEPQSSSTAPEQAESTKVAQRPPLQLPPHLGQAQLALKLICDLSHTEECIIPEIMREGFLHSAILFLALPTAIDDVSSVLRTIIRRNEKKGLQAVRLMSQREAAAISLLLQTLAQENPANPDRGTNAIQSLREAEETAMMSHHSASTWLEDGASSDASGSASSQGQAISTQPENQAAALPNARSDVPLEVQAQVQVGHRDLGVPPSMPESRSSSSSSVSSASSALSVPLAGSEDLLDKFTSG